MCQETIYKPKSLQKKTKDEAKPKPYKKYKGVVTIETEDPNGSENIFLVMESTVLADKRVPWYVVKENKKNPTYTRLYINEKLYNKKHFDPALFEFMSVKNAKELTANVEGGSIELYDFDWND